MKTFKCLNCKKNFLAYGNPKFCSRKCYIDYHYITKICSYCKRKFKIIRSKIKRKFCSKYCQSKFNWKVGIFKPKKKTGIYKKCLICGKEFYVHQYLIKIGEGKYCSRKCLGIANGIRLKNKPPKYYMFGGSGGTINRMAKKSILSSNRNLNYCELCGLNGSGREIHIHHINLNEQDNRPENLIVLCWKCHNKLHSFLYKNLNQLPNYEQFILEQTQIFIKKSLKSVV